MDMSHNVVTPPFSVMIYSNDWTHHGALSALYQSTGSVFAIVSSPRDINAFLNKVIESQPSLAVLDISPRNSVSIILMLRQQCPNTALILTQETFLFSDCMVAEYFDGVLLKTYDTVMDASYSLLIAESRHFICALRERNSAISVFSQRNSQSISTVLMDITQLMYTRFSQMIASPRAQQVVLGWLVRGVSPIAVGKQLGCGSKVIYHYRSMAMRVLGVRHCTRDFIASLKVTAGPVTPYLPPETFSPVGELTTLDAVETSRWYPALIPNEAVPVG